jgi:3-dehydroquinate synthase
LKHGEAIAIGMEIAARLAWLRGTATRTMVREQRGLLCVCGLPVDPPPVDFDRLWEFLRRDKKVKNGKVRFVLPRKIGVVEVVGGIDRRLLRAAWRTAP